MKEDSTQSQAKEEQASPNQPRFPLYVYKLGILGATVLWGLSFFIMKDAVDEIPASFLLGFRFLVCGALMSLIFWRRMRAHFTRDYIFHGFVIGTLLYIAYWFQTYGLMDTTPGKNAFLTAVYCVIVPFAWWIIARRRPTVFNVVAAVLCVIGIGCVSVFGAEDSSGTFMGRGDALTLVCAVFFALHIVFVAKVSPVRDVFVLTAYLFLFAGIWAMVISLLTEVSPATVEITGQLVLEVAYLTICASFLALLIQNVALQYVPPAQASLILCLESVFGVIFSVIFANEQLTPMLVLGFVLIFVAAVLSEAGTSIRDALTERAKRRNLSPQNSVLPAETSPQHSAEREEHERR